MKRTLKEDLERIHGLTYGNKIITESGFVDKILNNVGLGTDKEKTDKVDDPKRADLVSDDVTKFYENLKSAADSGGLTQQGSGSRTYQKEVESMQIGLLMLNYQLPQHGVDGLFGPETADAVTKFISDNKIGDTKKLNESASVVSSGGSLIGKPGQGTHNASDWQSRNAWDVTAPKGANVISISSGTVDKVRKTNGKMIKSGNKIIFGDQITIKSSDGKPDVFYTHIDTKLNTGDSVKEGDIIGTIIELPGMPTHVHVGLSSGNLSDYSTLKSATGGGAGSGGTGDPQTMTKATPEMLNKLMELLKNKGVTSEELKKYIDAVKTGGGAAFTDLDLTTDEGVNAYSQICQKFIDSRPPNLLGITGAMMAKGAKEAFGRYQRYVPAELALAQLEVEGGIGNKDPNSRPIRTKNPFNVGNTDSGSNVEHNEVQSGINTYFNLIAKSYLGKGKTANDLVNNFVNQFGSRYASSTDYEISLNKLAGEANRIAQPIVASLSKTSGSDIG